MRIFCLSDVYIVLLSPDEALGKVETRSDSSAHTALNCFRCIAYVFECNAVKMTYRTVSKHISISSLRSQTSK